MPLKVINEKTAIMLRRNHVKRNDSVCSCSSHNISDLRIVGWMSVARGSGIYVYNQGVDVGGWLCLLEVTKSNLRDRIMCFYGEYLVTVSLHSVYKRQKGREVVLGRFF